MKTCNTKMMRFQYYRYCESNYERLSQIYETWSSKKDDAYKECKELMKSLGGKNFRIISYNAWMFTAGFVYRDEDGKKWFVYMSRTNTNRMLLKGVS